jgi:predicted RND superfamily exporter protein
MIPFALPLQGYRNKNDRKKEQEEKMGLWQLDQLKPMKQMQKVAPMGVKPYAGFPFALNYDISDVILKQVWWLVGSFSFLFVFAVFSMRTVFVSTLGTLGVFFPIPCAVCCMNGIFHIMHVDVIDVIALFLICGIGADCLFIIFELFRQAKSIYPNSIKKRLAWSAQRGLIALATSISTSAVSFLALCISGVRIMNFFGIFSFLLLFFTFVFTFTWYLGIISIWAVHFEEKVGLDEELISITGPNQSTDTSTTSSGQSSSVATPEYPKAGIFDFLHKKPVFGIDSAGLPIEQYNVYERFFYNYVSPVIYFYRLPIVLVFLVWSAIFGYFAFQIGTKSELQFFRDDHYLQRAYILAANKFSTALNDFSYVYVWGIDPKPKVKLSQRMTVDDYGDTDFTPFNISDPVVQDFIQWTWDKIHNQSWIDTNATVNFGVNPWRSWDSIINMDQTWVMKLIELFINATGGTAPPTEYPITPDQYKAYGIMWQTMLSALAYEEPDSYVPGTLKANTVGFSLDDYGLKFIGMKQNMKIPDVITVHSLRQLYENASRLERIIQDEAVTRGIPEFSGWMTGSAWLTMVTEEQLPKQVIKDVGLAFGCGAIVILIATFDILYTIYVLYSMLCTIFLTMGVLYFTGWKIGTNEAIMISIASGFCADFIIQPMLALAHDYSARSLYGKIQASLTTFCTPVSSALITTLVAACFLYPCEIMLFPPFATFLLGSGLFGIIQGFFVLPALVALISFNKGRAVEKSQNHVQFFTNDDADQILVGPDSGV